MTIDERELEENEAKLDNILHKIVEAAKQIQELQESTNPNAPVEYNAELLTKIGELAQVVIYLAEAADDIDIVAEHVTKDLEHDIQDKLDTAIDGILAAKAKLRE